MIPDEYPLSEPFSRAQTGDEPLYNSREKRFQPDWESQAKVTLETRLVPIGCITPAPTFRSSEKLPGWPHKKKNGKGQS